ncbi:MAG TPA: DUF5686 family protein [Paludibacteraceae bacterium]|nr:DUF5686 family protein [Paludibacteraceae bacterium]
MRKIKICRISEKSLLLFRFMMGILLTEVLFVAGLQAQETIVVGQVIDKYDKHPLSSVSIYFKGTSVGTTSNEEGYFLLRHTGKENILVFSAIGYKKTEIKIKPGSNIGLTVEMEESNTLLQEVFILPGANPALDLMRKVRLLRKVNDETKLPHYEVLATEQNAIFLSRSQQRSISKQIFLQLQEGNLLSSDSSLLVPLYMDEIKYQLTSTAKTELSKKIFSSSEEGNKILEQLFGELNPSLNFYENSIPVFNKNIISPLASIGNMYYNYYLADSMVTSSGKQYEIHFRSRNPRNPAFNGKFCLDSASLALTYIEAELPSEANFNFIRHLSIKQEFVPFSSKRWVRNKDQLSLVLNLDILTDSVPAGSQIFFKRSTIYNTGSIQIPESFAQSGYSEETLNQKLQQLGKTPLMNAAKWLADIIFTGYIPVGKIDIGKIQYLARTTDVEGLRLTLPFRTNEKMWKNFTVGGFVGYGFKNEAIKYSGFTQYKLPAEKRRIIGLNYTNDYRRIDYNYNNFLYLENPLVSGDEDIAGTIFALRSAGRLNERKEWTLSFSGDWNRNIESGLYFRSLQQLPSDALPLKKDGVDIGNFQQQSFTFSTRFSFNEKKYEDHLQRIYINNRNPIIYGILEVGKYELGNTEKYYGKVSGILKQNVQFDLGQVNYWMEAGSIFGSVPYPLLAYQPGAEGGYGFYRFSMMNFMQFAADKYFDFHGELIMNGLILNHIPLLKYLNMREMFSVKFGYGKMSNDHLSVMDFPAYVYPFNRPYTEVGVGLANILHLFNLQAIWRLTDIKQFSGDNFAIRGSLRISF